MSWQVSSDPNPTVGTIRAMDFLATLRLNPVHHGMHVARIVSFNISLHFAQHSNNAGDRNMCM